MSRKRDLFLFPKYSTRADHSWHYFITHFQCSSSKQEFCLFVKTHLTFPSITDSAYMNQTPNNLNKQIKVANHHIKTKITKLFPLFPSLQTCLVTIPKPHPPPAPPQAIHSVLLPLHTALEPVC